MLPKKSHHPYLPEILLKHTKMITFKKTGNSFSQPENNTHTHSLTLQLTKMNRRLDFLDKATKLILSTFLKKLN